MPELCTELSKAEQDRFTSIGISSSHAKDLGRPMIFHSCYTALSRDLPTFSACMYGEHASYVGSSQPAHLCEVELEHGDAGLVLVDRARRDVQHVRIPVVRLPVGAVRHVCILQRRLSFVQGARALVGATFMGGHIFPALSGPLGQRSALWMAMGEMSSRQEQTGDISFLEAGQRVCRLQQSALGGAGLSEGQSSKTGRTWATLVTTVRIPGFATCSTIVLYAGCVYLTTALASVAPLADTSAARPGSVSWHDAKMFNIWVYIQHQHVGHCTLAAYVEVEYDR